MSVKGGQYKNNPHLYVDDLLLGEDQSKIEDITCQLGKLYQ